MADETNGTGVGERVCTETSLSEVEVEQHVCCLKPRLCRDEHFHQRDVERILAARESAAATRARAEALREAVALFYTIDATENGIGSAQRELSARIARGES